MSFIAKLSETKTETEGQDDDFEWILSEERRRLCAELATYRSELLGGFKSPQRKARCSEICRRLVEIDLQLSDEEE